MKGEYICTIDNYHQDADIIDYATSELPSEHKSFNLIELVNGQYASIQTIEHVFLIIFNTNRTKSTRF